MDNRSATINAAGTAEPHTAFATVHEVGHLQDAHHTPGRYPNPEAFPYGYAFRNDTIKTIMPTGAQQGTPHFSGPDLDDARVLRETAV